MKKKNVLCALLSNAAIIAFIAVLFFTCNPIPVAMAVSSPYYYGDRNSGKVALMFNVYEGSEYVEEILDILERRKATCTFFVGGVWGEKNVPLLRKMSERAELGTHGYLHKDHKTLSKKRNEEELLLCHSLVKKTTGVEMHLFAPPSGSYGDTCLDVCSEHGYTVVMWTKDTIDWRDKDHELILKRATSDIQSGDLILMHPTENTVKALPFILDRIYDAGLEPTTVSDVLGERSI